MTTKEQKARKLMELGVAPSLSGFRAILELLEVWKPGDKLMVSYAIAGRRIGTTGGAIERNIRHAIERAMLYNHTGMTEFMGNAYNPYKGYPTSSEFISCLWMYFNEADT